MITMADLSLDQTPPLDLPLRLFLTAPLFATAAGVVLMIDADAVIATRWSPSALAATHLITVGFLGQVMIGALLQMLPVLGGVPVPAVRRVATSVHVLLGFGAALLALGFLGGGAAVLASGAAAAGLGLAVFGLVMLMALWRARQASPRGFSLVGVVLLATVAVGLVLTLAVMGRVASPRLLDWVQVHVAWGLFGWVGLLILIVGFQVVPLFHVTPAYPRWMSRTLVPTLFLALCVITALPLLAPTIGSTLGYVTYGVIALGYSLFALATLILQARRARTKLDATLLHWWIAMGAVLATVLAWLMGASGQLMGLWLLIGVGVGLPSGMLLKIVPFLCWLHLQRRQIALGKRRVRLPHLQQLIPNVPARLQVALHGCGLLLSGLGFVYPPAAHAGGALLALAALWLLALLLGATRRYREAFARLTLADSDQRTS